MKSFERADFQLPTNAFDETFEGVRAPIVGGWFSILLNPVQIALAEVVERDRVKRHVFWIGHHLVEFFERLVSVLAELDLLSAGREIPALVLASKEGLWSAWQ